MKMQEFVKLGVPLEIVAAWQRDFGETTLPIQEKAVTEGDLCGSRNLILLGATGTGKTFAGEVAAILAVQAGHCVFFIESHRALADEKHAELDARYAPLGLRVVVSSSDRREFDEAIAERQFDIAVVVPEKLQSLLIRHPELADHVGLVVVDELQMLGQAGRGAALDLLLTKLRRAAKPPRIVGLSSAVGHPHGLGEWLDALVVEEPTRPVELYNGVLCRGWYRAVGHNSGEQLIERFEDHARDNVDDQLAHTAKELVLRGERVLLFVPDRRRSVGVAHLLARLLPDMPAAEAAIADLAGQPECLSRESLTTVLGHSVAFHNADLAREERNVVTKHFRNGTICAIVATSTLATGLNLPADAVIVSQWRWRPNKRLDRWTYEEISRAEYDSMSGRAGRLCSGKASGRSILVTSSPFEAQVLKKRLLLGPREVIAPRLHFVSLEDAVLDLVAGGARMRSEIDEALLATYSGRVYWRKALRELARSLDAAIAASRLADCLELDGARAFRLSPLGWAAARSGIRFESAAALAPWARTASSDEPCAIELLLVAQLSPAGRQIHVPLAGGEQRSSCHRIELARRAADARVAHRPAIAAIVGDLRLLSSSDQRALKKVLILLDLLDGAAVIDIERRYRIWTGTLQRIAEDSAWLLRGIAEIGAAVGWKDEACARLRRLAKSLTRSHASRGVAAAPDTEPAPQTLRSGRTPSSPSSAPIVPLAVVRPGETLVVDLAMSRVSFAGHDVPTTPGNLQRLPLLGLAALATHPGRLFTMLELARGMQEVGSLEKRPTEPYASDVRYKILHALRRALDGKVERHVIDRLIETIPGRGLRLRADIRATVVPVAARSAPAA